MIVKCLEPRSYQHVIKAFGVVFDGRTHLQSLVVFLLHFLLSLELVFASQQSPDLGCIVMRLQVRRFFDLIDASVPVRFDVLFAFSFLLVAEALDENLRVARALDTILNNADVFDFAA